MSVEVYMSQSLPPGFCSDVTYHRDFPALSIQNKMPVLTLHPLSSFFFSAQDVEYICVSPISLTMT